MSFAGGTSTPATGSAKACQIRETFYPCRCRAEGPEGREAGNQPPLPELSYGYVYKFTPVVEMRLNQAGVRLAAYLNAVYAEPQPAAPSSAHAACFARLSHRALPLVAARPPDASRARCAKAAAVEVQILAFNDFHGNLEPPAPVEVTEADGTKRKILTGGVGNLAAALTQFRAKAIRTR